MGVVPEIQRAWVVIKGVGRYHGVGWRRIEVMMLEQSQGQDRQHTLYIKRDRKLGEFLQSKTMCG